MKTREKVLRALKELTAKANEARESARFMAADIAERVGVTAGTARKHLKTLAAEGLVRGEHDWRWDAQSKYLPGYLTQAYFGGAGSCLRRFIKWELATEDRPGGIHGKRR
jgi:DNA-binding transcriptional ArsR family regulator